MERLPLKEELRLMPEKIETSNIKNFCEKTLHHFFLDKESCERIVNRIEEGGTDEERFLDNLFELNKQLRAWFVVDDPLLFDEGYALYINQLDRNKSYIHYFLERNPDVNEEIFIKSLYSMDTFFSNKITIGKTEFKLFKFLRKEDILTGGCIEDITTRKTKANEGHRICISRNPIDYLYISTNQNYSSCINLDKIHTGYMGLGGMCLDPNRFLIFVTSLKNNKNKHILKGINYTHFKYLSRSWALIGEDKIVAIRKYPRSLPVYKNILEYIKSVSGLPCIDTALSLIEGVPKQDREALFKSKFDFILPKHTEDYASMVYLDHIGMKFKDHKTCYYSASGRVGNHYCSNNYLTFSEIKVFNDVLYKKVFCIRCKSRVRVDDSRRTVFEEYLCNVCFDEVKVECDRCGNHGIRDKRMGRIFINYFRYHIILENGKIAKKLCLYCQENMYHCSICKKLSLRNKCHRCEKKRFEIKRTGFKAGDLVMVKSKSLGDYRSKEWLDRKYGRSRITKIRYIKGDGSGRDGDNCIVIGGSWFRPTDLEIAELRIGDFVMVKKGKGKLKDGKRTTVTKFFIDIFDQAAYGLKGDNEVSFNIDELEYLG